MLYAKTLCCMPLILLVTTSLPGLSSGFLGNAELRRQPAPKDWMRNVYSALTGSNQGAYEIQVQSSSDSLKVAPACIKLSATLLLGGLLGSVR